MNEFELPKRLKCEEQKQLFVEHNNKKNKILRDKLILSNMRLVVYVINMKFSDSNEKDDLFSIGLIGLIKAVDNYNAELGEFSTFAVSCIKIEILHYLRDKKDFYYFEDIKNIDKYLDDGSNFVEEIEERNIIERVMNEFKNFTGNKKEILLACFNTNSLTQKSIANKFNVSQQNISKVKKKVIKKIQMNLDLDKK